MTGVPSQKRKGYVAIGGFGLLFATAYLGMSLQLPLGRMDQPGAGVFPIIVGTLMVLISLVTVWEGWQLEKAETIEWPAGADRKRLLCLVGLMVGYVVALPWLGQIISATLFCLLLMRVLSNLGWLRIGMYSLIMSAALYWVFVVLLNVPMPRGILAF